MTDIDEAVRELLRRRAAEVRTHGEMPNGVGRRARRRVAVSAAGVALAVALVLGGATAAFRLVAIGGNQPAGEGATGPVGSASPSAPAVAGCTADELAVSGSMQGAMGSREGVVLLRNVGDHACTLDGTPTITLLDRNGQAITSGVTLGTSPAQWQADALPEPAGWPLVKVVPGAEAQVRIRWTNWCLADAPGWEISLPSGGSAAVSGIDDLGTPPCNGPGQPSTIEVGPFEPALAPSGSSAGSGP